MYKVIFITKGVNTVHTIIESFSSLDAAEEAADIYNAFHDQTMRLLAKRLYDPIKARRRIEEEHRANA